MTSKERAHFRSLANTMQPILQIGKNGLSAILADFYNRKMYCVSWVILELMIISPAEV